MKPQVDWRSPLGLLGFVFPKTSERGKCVPVLIFLSTNLIPIDQKEERNENKEKQAFFDGIIHGIFGSTLFRGPAVLAAPPQGVLKEAIHWGISADWFDPAISGTYMSLFNLFLIHDALLKPMPEGTYAACLRNPGPPAPITGCMSSSCVKG